MLDFILMTPIYLGVDGITCWSVEKAHVARLNNFLWVPGTEGKGDALICRNRSVMATSFMEHGLSDYMIFLDSDIVFEPSQLKQIGDDLKEGYDIVGGMYPVRSGTDWASHFWGGKSPEGDLGICEIQFLATGFMGISKYALQKIVKEYKYPDGRPFPLLHANTEGARSYPFFEAGWYHNEIADGDGSHDVWLSEDYDFCEKARAVGFKIYADTRIQLGHQGQRIVTGKDVDLFKKTLAEAEDNAKKKEDSEKRDRGEWTDHVGASTEGTECST